MVVIATAGLFLLAGASFLAAGTVIVYAGAIIVTFLFVIMLAQMEGKAVYDRAARMPGPRDVLVFLALVVLDLLSVGGRFQAGNGERPGDREGTVHELGSCAQGERVPSGVSP